MFYWKVHYKWKNVNKNLFECNMKNKGQLEFQDNANKRRLTIKYY